MTSTCRKSSNLQAPSYLEMKTQHFVVILYVPKNYTKEKWLKN